MAEKEQTVVTETDVPAEPASEVNDARADDTDDLDSLLAQYEKEAVSETSSTPGQTGEAQDQQLAGKIDALEQSLVQMASKADMDATINAIRGDLDPEVFDDVFVEAWLNAQATTDPRLATAWTNRQNNPKQFAKVKAELGRNFSKKFTSLPNKEATDDREVVAAAVRGASTKAPEGKTPDYSGLSDQEYASQVEKEHGFRPI